MSTDIENTLENDVVDVIEEEDVESDEESTASSALRKIREPITLYSVLGEVSKIKQIVIKELDKQMKSTEKTKNAKIFRILNKRIDVLEKHIPKIKKTRLQKELKLDEEGNVIVPKNSFSMLYDVSKELLQFANCKPDTKLSRQDVQAIIGVYIYLNPEEDREKMLKWKHLNPINPKTGVGRDLRNPEDKRKIIPDAKLTKLLRYDKYKADVKGGLITLKPKSSPFGAPPGTTPQTTMVTDDTLYYYVIMKLVQPHFLKRAV